MSGQALYRRWRSQTFDQIIAQEHVTRTLQNALRAGRVAHAYLFTGPRGTGKTSTARILAKAVNCLAEPDERPCNSCARCQAVSEGRALDLIEIDAASNRGIDEIRDLRDKIAFAPSEGRFKVYVVDEVHMLTSEAFNALLKTLEEPPSHVIFVLATTEPQRIPATILSRCQRFDFRRIPVADLAGKLQRIAEAEGIAIQPAAVEAIARRAAGSFRDGESLLDQLAAYGDAEITLERVQELLGGVSTQAVADLVDAWLAADLGAGLRLINQLVDSGTDARQLQLELIDYLRHLLLLQSTGGERPAGDEVTARMRAQLSGLSLGRLVEGLRIFGQSEAVARGDVRPQLPLELAFAQAVLANSAHEERPAPAEPPARERPRAALPTRAKAPPTQARAAPECPQHGAAEVHPTPQPEGDARPASVGGSAGEARPGLAEGPAGEARLAPAEGPAGEARLVPAEGSAGDGTPLVELKRRWPEVLKTVRGQSKPLEALLRSGQPCEVSGGRVVLAMSASFHRERVMEERNRRLLEEILAGFLGAPCQVECILRGERRAGRHRSSIDHPVVRDDPILRYAVQDLGAQVSSIQTDDDEGAAADGR